MKRYWNRLASAVVVLSMCAGLIIPAAAIPSKDDLAQAVTPISLSASAQELNSGNYRVKYEADLTMSEIFAEAVVSLNTGDYLKKLQFTCVLRDDLVSQMTLDDVSFTFAGKGASIFVPDGENYVSLAEDGQLMIRYKLNPELVDEFLYMRASQIVDTLMQKVVVTSDRKVVPASAILEAKDDQGVIKTSARVEITYADGDIPVYDEPYILAAESGEVKMTIRKYVKPDPKPETPAEPAPEVPAEPKPEVPVEPKPEVPVEPKPEVPAEPKPEIPVTPVKPEPETPVTPVVPEQPKFDITIAPAEPAKPEPEQPKPEQPKPEQPKPEQPAPEQPKPPQANRIEAAAEQQAAGSTVTVTEKLEEGFRVTNIEVLDSEGNKLDVDVSRNGDGTYSFEMPEQAVTVVPTFDVAVTAPEDSGVSELLDTKSNNAFMVGDDTGSFRPSADITRAEVAQVFYSLLLDKDVEQTVKFSDVEEGAWYEKAVNTLAALGIVSGVGNDMYDPTRPITRAEFAVIAANFAKLAEDNFGFKDVNDGHWAYEYIMAAAAYGWVAGVGNNNYEPGRNIQRAEAATIVNNMLGRVDAQTSIDTSVSIRDVDPSHWAYRYIAAAFGLIVP